MDILEDSQVVEEVEEVKNLTFDDITTILKKNPIDRTKDDMDDLQHYFEADNPKKK